MDYKKRIVVNTLAQHIRTILNICMSLYSTRYILLALGNSDFGIFSLVGSMVAMLGFITNAMVVTTQRYLSYSQGNNDRDNARKIFSNSLIIHFVIGILLSTLLLAIEPCLFNGFLKIEPSRTGTASYVFILMILVLFISFITSPFRALFIARENIVYISIIDFLDGFFKLLFAIILLQVQADRLKTYAWMVACITTFNLLAFVIYAKKHFEETQIIPKRSDIDINCIRNIMGFAGWTIYSTGCIIGRTQGMAVVLNKFWGTVINTSYGIASQISGALQFISQSILNAMSPQIIKAEGSNDRKRMLALSESTSKYSFLLLSLAVVPLIFEMPAILSLWLGDVPPDAVLFCRFILISSMVDQTTIGLGVANQAIGKIRTYSLTINTIKVMTLPIVWLCLKLGLPVVSAMWCYVIVETICAMIRLPFLKYTAGLSISHYISNVVARLLLPILALIITGWLITTAINIPFRFIITIIISITIGLITIWETGLTQNERKIAIDMIKQRKRK